MRAFDVNVVSAWHCGSKTLLIWILDPFQEPPLPAFSLLVEKQCRPSTSGVAACFCSGTQFKGKCKRLQTASFLVSLGSFVVSPGNTPVCLKVWLPTSKAEE